MSHSRTLSEAHLVSRTVAAVSLALAGPVLLLAALLIKVSSPGPVLFRATRLGRGGCPFTMLKLRTMHVVPDQGGLPRITGGEDPRVFAVGRWMRRLKIDELPQLVNIVRGDMVIVGPRPEDASIVAGHHSSLLVQTLGAKPGLVSPGTLDYFARETSLPRDSSETECLYLSVLMPRKNALDLVYLQNRSWRYDVEIVVRAIACILGVRIPFERHRAWELRCAQELLRGATSTR